ncbi:MAG: hypothetical protein CMO97_05380 [Woeseia sp.]|nr:hypothetical protein [Woeseia sp.]
MLEAKQIKSHNALRRQKQYIGKLMRFIDAELIDNELNKISN